MYIEPNSTIELYKGIPLDISYKNTLYFSTIADQNTYFSNAKYDALTSQTYLRQGEPFRIQKNYQQMLGCNYLRIRNINYENKWFYFFVTDITYISNNVTEINVVLDVMQTWHFNYTLMQSFVEREHTITDNVGDNLLPESLDLGEYVINSSNRTFKFLEWKIIVATTVDIDGNPVVGNMYSGIYSGVKYLMFDDADSVNNFLNEITILNKQDSIVNIYMMPSEFISESGNSTKSIAFETDKWLTNIDGYVPVNKKLLTYPYNYMIVNNQQGTNAEFRYEFFNSEKCEFLLQCDYAGNPTVLCTPYEYKVNTGTNLNEKITLGNFPQCAYNIDAYKAWFAQNGGSWFLGMLGQAFNTGTTSNINNFSKNGGGLNAGVSAVGGVIGIAQSINQAVVAKSLPPQAYGSTNGSILISTANLDFWFYNVSITSEFAQIIDNYFTMHGYAVKRVKVPNRSNRPRYTYVKTIDCNIIGPIPEKDLNIIRGNFDKGITFWRNASDVGNYAVDNRPI